MLFLNAARVEKLTVDGSAFQTLTTLWLDIYLSKPTMTRSHIATDWQQKLMCLSVSVDIVSQFLFYFVRAEVAVVTSKLYSLYFASWIDCRPASNALCRLHGSRLFWLHSQTADVARCRFARQEP